MVLSSWISFAVNFEAVPGRLGMLLTLFLMLINLSNTVSQTIPKSDKICPLILWIMISLAFVVLALVEYFIILLTVKFHGANKVSEKKWRHELDTDQMNNWALKLDKGSLAVFPAAYFVTTLIFFLKMFA